jgi:hypothetical protein
MKGLGKKSDGANGTKLFSWCQSGVSFKMLAGRFWARFRLMFRLQIQPALFTAEIFLASKWV